MQDIEEKLAHLMRSVEDLSDELARRGREIDRLTARVEMLLRREAEREAAEGGGAVFTGNERPPHW